MSALLPRLRRFALVLAGDPGNGDALLRDALRTMLEASEAGTPDGAGLDRWAFARIHAVWLDNAELRRESMLDADETLIADWLAHWGGEGLEVEDLAAFLCDLPPQQRAAVLLVHGEGLSYAAAADILGTAVETVAARSARTLTELVERLDLAFADDPAGYDESPLDDAREAHA